MPAPAQSTIHVSFSLFFSDLKYTEMGAQRWSVIRPKSHGQKVAIQDLTLSPADFQDHTSQHMVNWFYFYKTLEMSLDLHVSGTHVLKTR